MHVAKNIICDGLCDSQTVFGNLINYLRSYSYVIKMSAIV